MSREWFNDGHRRFFILLLLLLLCNRKRDLVTRREKVTCQRSISFYLFFFFFSLLFFLHFTCCNFISFEDKSFHYGSRCFVTFVLVPCIYSYGYYSLWELSEDPRYHFVIFIADVYQGVCLEQSTNCEKNIWKFFWIVVSSYSFWIS